MLYYRIAVDRKVPTTWLTYSSEDSLKVGQMVAISVRKSEGVGVVLEEVPYPGVETKSVGALIPVRLTQTYLRFLDLFCYNTLNDYNNVLSIIASWVAKFSKKQIQELTKNFQLEQVSIENTAKDQNTKNIEYYIEKEQWLRIKIIIRSLISDKGRSYYDKAPVILLLVSEKSLQNYYSELLQEEFGNNLNTLLFSGDSSAASRSTLFSLLNIITQPTLIIATRAGVFLPFPSLDMIIVSDESSHLYIQEQNSVYFDTRDASYLLSQAFGAKLVFTSALPSIRRFYFDSEATSDHIRDNYTINKSKLPKIKIYKREKKDTFFDIFSTSILEDIDAKLIED